MEILHHKDILISAYYRSENKSQVQVRDPFDLPWLTYTIYVLFSEELIINVKKSELQPTDSDLVLFCHIARRWLSSDIILSQTETNHKQRAFPQRYAYFKLSKVYSFYTALAFHLDWLWITGLLYWLTGLLLRHPMPDKFCLLAWKITGDPFKVKVFAKGYNYVGQLSILKTLQKVLEGT